MNFARIIAILACIAIAWYLGYRARPRSQGIKQKNKISRDYLQGLNFLLNEETDKAVDVFIKLLEVDSDTVETHLAVAKLFRRRGEVDRAIRIHQNLIARPQLDKIYREQALFELGQDYLSAGMLDRAERIFTELVSEKSHSAQALLSLIDIYQQEKSWNKAIDAACQYQLVTKKSMKSVISQYYCELASQEMQKKQWDSAESLLTKAINADKNCVRACLLLAKVCMAQGDDKQAIRHLKKIRDLNPDFLAEAIDLLATCYERLNQEDEFIDYLKKIVSEYPRVPVVLILAERIRKWKGDKVAAQFVADYVRQYPSLRGLHLFVSLYISSAEGRAKEDLHILQNLMHKTLANKPDYQCSSCGFSAKKLDWQCPGCKQWGTMLPIYIIEEATA